MPASPRLMVWWGENRTLVCSSRSHHLFIINSSHGYQQWELLVIQECFLAQSMALTSSEPSLLLGYPLCLSASRPLIEHTSLGNLKNSPSASFVGRAGTQCCCRNACSDFVLWKLLIYVVGWRDPGFYAVLLLIMFHVVILSPRDT